MPKIADSDAHEERTTTQAPLPDASVVVVAHNEQAKISACMRSLANQRYPSAKVEFLLIDDGSTDATVERARRACPAVRVIANPSRSISSNRNRGWRCAQYRYVAFLDADCVAPPGWLATLTSAIQRLGAAAVGGGNVPPAGESRFYDALAIMLSSYLGSRGSVQGTVFRHEREVAHLPGLNVVFDRLALQRVDGYDESFARIGEDEDLSQRLRDQGHRLYYVPGAVVVHRQRGDLGSWARNMYTYGKGRSWLIRRHPRALSPSMLLPPAVPLALPAYASTIAAISAWRALSAGRPELMPHLAALFSATHLPYATGQIAGLFDRGDSSASQRRDRRRVGLVVLKNAGNKGDEAIFVSVCRRLRQRGSGPALYALGLGPSGFDPRLVPQDESAVERLALDLCAADPNARRPTLSDPAAAVALTRLLYVLSSFDRILFCGGQWIHDLNPSYHLLITGLLRFARLFGTRTGVFCVGSGPLRATWARALTCGAFGQEGLIVVRDAKSLRLYQDIGLKQATLAADPALELQSAAPTQLPVVVQPRTVGFCPCAWGKFENVYRRDTGQIAATLEQSLASISQICSRGYSVLLLPTMNPEDSDFCRQILQRLGHAARQVQLIDTASVTPSQLQGMISQLELLISMRLHPMIFAANTATPFIALNYAEKVAAFCHQLGWQNYLVELEGDWSTRVLDCVDRISQTRSQLQLHIQTAHRPLSQTLTAAYDQLRQWMAS